MPASRKDRLKLPPLRPGDWRGEIVGTCSANFGQVVQDGPPRQSVEFTYVVMPASQRFAQPLRLNPDRMKAGHKAAAASLRSAAGQS